MANNNRCEVYKDGSEFYVHFMVNNFHSDTDSFDNFLDAAGAMQDWIKKGEE